MFSQEQAEALGHAAEHYVWRNSKLARTFPDTAWELSGVAIRLLRHGSINYATRQDAERKLRRELHDNYSVSSAGIWWPIIRVLIPIVARLIVNWWFSKMAEGCSEDA